MVPKGINDLNIAYQACRDIKRFTTPTPHTETPTETFGLGTPLHVETNQHLQILLIQGAARRLKVVAALGGQPLPQEGELLTHADKPCLGLDTQTRSVILPD